MRRIKVQDCFVNFIFALFVVFSFYDSSRSFQFEYASPRVHDLFSATMASGFASVCQRLISWLAWVTAVIIRGYCRIY